MNKVKEFLEKNAQWLALGLGVLWLFFMVYDNVLASKTATVEVNRTELVASNVDQYIEENTIKTLQDQIGNNQVLPPLKNDYTVQVKRKLALADERPMLLVGNWIPSLIQMGITLPTPPTPTGEKITHLPVIPAPVNPDVTSGKSIINGAAVGGGAAGGQQRQLWATVFAAVPMADMRKAFEDANIPKLDFPPAQLTMFLKVEIVRTELLPNGQFGNPVTITSLPVDLNNNAAPPAGLTTFPGNKPQEELQFKAAAATAQKVICQPEFFTVTKGDGWRKPGQPLVKVGEVAQPTVPTPPPVAPPPTPRVPPTRPPRTPGGTRGNGGRPVGKAINGFPGVVVMNAMQLAPSPNDGQGGMGGADVGNGGYVPPRPAGQPGQPGQPPAVPLPPGNAVGEAPAGPFSPSNSTDVTIWAHDLTVQSGKTYQYQIRYTISNPVFLFKNVCPPGNPGWADQFAINSPLSVPTQAVTIPDTTSYFVSTFFDHKNDTVVKFDVFTWDVNGVVRNSVAVSPGDLIDPNLKLTLVDARSIGNSDAEIILMDDSGNLITRYKKSDEKNPDYDNLKKEAH